MISLHRIPPRSYKRRQKKSNDDVDCRSSWSVSDSKRPQLNSIDLKKLKQLHLLNLKLL